VRPGVQPGFATFGLSNSVKEQLTQVLYACLVKADRELGNKPRHFCAFFLTNEGTSDTGDQIIVTDMVSSMDDENIAELLREWLDKNGAKDG